MATASNSPAPGADAQPARQQPQLENGNRAETDPRQWGWLEASPGKLAAGLFFGVIFGFLLQKGGVAKFDILVGVLGLLLGSYLYALSTNFGSGVISRWGARGKLTLPELLGISPGLFIAVAAPLLVAVLIFLEVAGY